MRIILFFCFCIFNLFAHDLPQLEKTGQLEVQVADSKKNPLQNTEIEIQKEKRTIHIKQTDATGKYTFLYLKPGSYTVKVKKNDAFAPGEYNVSIFADQTTTLDAILEQYPGVVEGEVVDAITKKPIQGVIILIEALHDEGFVTSAVTNKEGLYTLSSLAPGNYTINVSADHYQKVILGTEVKPNHTENLNLSLKPIPVSINGQVTNRRGRPIPSAIISVEQSGTLVGTGITDQLGQYRIQELMPGDLLVKVNASDYQSDKREMTLEKNTESTLNFTLTPLPGIIVGQVFNVITGGPLQGAVITIEVLQGGVVITTGVSDPQGNYSISSLKPDTYTIRASAPSFQSVALDATVLSDQTTVFNFALKPLPGVLEGEVIDAKTNASIDGAVIAVEIAHGKIVVATAQTDKTGKYSIPNLPPGVYTVRASESDYQTTIHEVTILPGQSTVHHFVLTLL